MCLRNLRCLLLLALAVLPLCASKIDLAAYRQMPPLYVTDNYQECLHQKHSSHCLVYAEIQPNPESSLWQNINQYYSTSPKTRYRHDILYRGMCKANCNPLSKAPREINHTEMHRSMGPTAQLMTQLYPLSQQQKSVHDQGAMQLHQCLDDEMNAKYNLSVKSMVKYCTDPKEPLSKDFPYYFAYGIFVMIVFLSIMSTLFDFYLQTHYQYIHGSSTGYYDQKHKGTANHLLTSFSMYRNYRKLVKPNESAIGKDFLFVDGFRSLMSLTIFLEHLLLFVVCAVKDTEYIERFMESPYGIFIQHMLPCIELFFVMSGLMLFLKFSRLNLITETTSWYECLRVYGRLLLSRYLRYLPTLFAVSLFWSGIFLHIGNGPFWRHSIEPFSMQCRSYWWTHLLMIANSDVERTCGSHIWYVSADFQLYAVFLAILVVNKKCPKYKTSLYTIMATLALTIPSIINYVLKLTAIIHFNSEGFRHMHSNENLKADFYSYLKTYANFGGFLIGILCGELYEKYLKHESYRQKLQPFLKHSRLIGWSTICGIWMLGTKITLQPHSIWISLFPILHRPISVAIVTTMIVVRGMCMESGFLTFPIFRPIARISYQIYIWHFLIVVGFFSMGSEPFEITGQLLGSYLSLYFVSIVIAFIAAILVEYPFAALFSGLELKGKPKDLKAS